MEPSRLYTSGAERPYCLIHKITQSSDFEPSQHRSGPIPSFSQPSPNRRLRGDIQRRPMEWMLPYTNADMTPSRKRYFNSTGDRREK